MNFFNYSGIPIRNWFEKNIKPISIGISSKRVVCEIKNPKPLCFEYSRLLYSLLVFLLFSTSIVAQNSSQEKMEKLNFMIGDWVGTSTTFKDGTIDKQVPAFQKIKYDLNRHILVIDLRSELLQLHTIIYYDEKDKTYYYHPFSERGTNKLVAEYENGKLTVWSSKNKRYVFSKTSQNTFQEYGEQLKDGKWVRYFEDNFKNTQ